MRRRRFRKVPRWNHPSHGRKTRPCCPPDSGGQFASEYVAVITKRTFGARFFLLYPDGLYTKPAVYGVQHKLHTIIDAELVEDIREMVLHRVLTDAESSGDVLVGLAVHQGFNDLTLAVRQPQKNRIR